MKADHEKQPDEKVDFQGTEEPKASRKSRKTKCIVGVVALAILLVGAAISLTVFFLTKPKASQMLVDVNLKEGDTLMYRVDQRFEVTGYNMQKETITSIVGIQVVNKTTENYWFLLKMHTTFKDKDGNVRAKRSGYFRVRLQTKPQRTKTGNDTIEPYELHGKSQTDGEFVRYIHGVLYQFLPAVRRDLYEDVDGQTDKNLKPENSPSLPGYIRMHRKANTKQGDKVLIKNHFNRSDLVNSSSDLDLDVKYTDSSSINKSSGMVSESSVYLSERLNFGEQMKTKDGRDVTMLNVVLYSHVTRVEMDSASFFDKDEIKASKMDSFVKLVVPTTVHKSVDIEKDITTSSAAPTSSNSSSSNDSVVGQRLSTQAPTTVIIGRDRRSLDGWKSDSTNGDAAHKRRVRRDASPTIKDALRNMDVESQIENSFTLFQRKVIGVNIAAKSIFWMKEKLQSWSLGIDLKLKVGSRWVPVYGVEYTREQIEKEKSKNTISPWKIRVPLCFGVLFIGLCADFSLSFNIETPSVGFVAEETSLQPLKFAVQVNMSADIKASIEAYATIWILRAGVFVDGTIIRASPSAKLSHNSVQPVRQKWCFSAKVRFTALEISAGLFYQWRSWWNWGVRNTILSFGSWAAMTRDWELFRSCF